MPINVEPLLFDTSAALAFVDTDSPFHQPVWDLASQCSRGLCGHASFEFLSVLTRLPMPKRLHGADALLLMRHEFPANRFLPSDVMDDLITEFAQLGIVGGMVYDGLVGACARHHRLTLISCDRRVEDTYRLLVAPYQLIVA